MAFDAKSPKSTTKVKDSPALFQDNWAALSGCWANEHEGVLDTNPGEHLPGRCKVCFVGTTTTIAAITTPPGCAIAYDTTLSAAKYYSGSAWTILALDHGQFSGIVDDDHPQYFKLTKASQTITEDFTCQGSVTLTAGETVDGRDVSVDGTRLDSGYLLKFMTTAVNKVDWTAATDWTDVDISANTGSDTAKAAYLAVELNFSAQDQAGATDTVMTGLFRKNGSSETAILPRIKASGIKTVGYADFSKGKAACTVIVEVDSSEIFEVKLQNDSLAGSSISFKVDLIGYFV